jgi:hypothetical protein
MSAKEVHRRRQRRNRMAFAFYVSGIAAVVGIGGIAFASEDDPAWTTKTQVTVQIETGVPAASADPSSVPGAPGKPGSTSQQAAPTVSASTAGPAVTPTSPAAIVTQTTVNSARKAPRNSPKPTTAPTTTAPVSIAEPSTSTETAAAPTPQESTSENP